MQLPQFQVHADIEQQHWWFLGRLKIVRTLLHRVLPPDRNRLVVDVGCGTGGNTIALSRDYTCIGIDPSVDAIAFARERFTALTFRIGYAPQDCEDLLSRADAVLLMDVLEHVEDDFLLISSLLAAMKPGAYLFMIAPGDPTLWGEHDRGFEHVRRYTLPRFRRTWEGLPVRECAVSCCNARLYPLVKIARFLSRISGRSLGPARTDLSLPPRPVNAVLQRIFGGESGRFLRMLEGRSRPYVHGVSVLALLERRAGEIVPRPLPSDVPPDERPWMARASV